MHSANVRASNVPSSFVPSHFKMCEVQAAVKSSVGSETCQFLNSGAPLWDHCGASKVEGDSKRCFRSGTRPKHARSFQQLPTHLQKSVLGYLPFESVIYLTAACKSVARAVHEGVAQSSVCLCGNWRGVGPEVLERWGPHLQVLDEFHVLRDILPTVVSWKQTQLSISSKLQLVRLKLSRLGNPCKGPMVCGSSDTPEWWEEMDRLYGRNLMRWLDAVSKIDASRARTISFPISILSDDSPMGYAEAVARKYDAIIC
eukprot:Selendium_serpulae@DN5901_c0_g1_i11.p1